MAGPFGSFAAAPVRVALLVDDPGGGTYGNQARRLAAGLAADPRCTVTLLAYGPSRSDADPMPERTGTHAGGAPVVERLASVRARRAGPVLARYLVDRRPDVLVTHQVHMNLVAIGAAAWARRRGWTGRLVVGHDHPIDLSHRSTRLDNRHLARLLYRRADLVVVPSPGVADDAVQHCGVNPARVLLVPCAIEPAPPLARPDHPWFADGPPVFVTVGRLVAYKRFELLIDAVARLAADGVDARLAIVGVGPERGALEAAAARAGVADRVAFLGFVDDPRPYAAHATATVLASDEEGFSQVLTEAMSTGCPVVTTDAYGGGPRYVTDGGRAGILVARDDTAALASAMRALVDPSVRGRWGALARRRAADFAPDRCAAQLLDGLGVTPERPASPLASR